MWTLPNILTLSRIALAPVIALLPFINGWIPKFLAFLVFLAAVMLYAYWRRVVRRQRAGRVFDREAKTDETGTRPDQ